MKNLMILLTLMAVLSSCGKPGDSNGSGSNQNPIEKPNDEVNCGQQVSSIQSIEENLVAAYHLRICGETEGAMVEALNR